MIYVRSLGSIQLFPRASLALFLIYHFYYYSFPFGFHSLALLVMFLFLSALMIHCVRKYEIDAFYRGHVSIDQPRMLYNTVPWPSWNGSLAPDMTLFIPVFHRARSIYQDNVPDPAIGGTPFVASEQGPASVVGRPTDPAVQQYDSFQHSSTLATSSASVGAAAAADSSALEMSFVDSRVDVVGEEQPLATNSSLSRNTISRYLVSGNVSSRPHYSRLQSSEPQSLNNLPDVEND